MMVIGYSCISVFFISFFRWVQYWSSYFIHFLSSFRMFFFFASLLRFSSSRGRISPPQTAVSLILASFGSHFTLFLFVSIVCYQSQTGLAPLTTKTTHLKGLSYHPTRRQVLIPPVSEQVFDRGSCPSRLQDCLDSPKRSAMSTSELFCSCVSVIKLFV
jgi:hypothetical protein